MPELAHTYHIPRAPNAPPLTYYVVTPPGQPATNVPWHVILQGSSLESVSPAHLTAQSNSKQALFVALKSIGAPMIFIEKAGITAESSDMSMVHRYNTIDQRARNVVAVLNDLQHRYGTTDHVLIGASEGGEVALRAIACMPKELLQHLRALVLIAWGTDQNSEELVTAYLLQKYVPRLFHAVIHPLVFQYVRTRFRTVAAHPESPEKFFQGNSHRYWSSFMHKADMRTIMRNIEAPVCIVHGANDLLTANSDALLRDLQLNTHAPTTWLRYAHTSHRLDMDRVSQDLVRWLRHIRIAPN